MYRKRFGQHFLIDEDIIDKIISVFAPQLHDIVVEIGPGGGALTLLLVKLVKELHAIEIDRDLASQLQTYESKYSQLHIHCNDILKFNFEPLPHTFRMIGNLPYQISTPLFFHLLEYKPRIQDGYFMVQKEVADRMCARTGTKEYGRLSVMLQYHFEIDLLFNISPMAFNPPPNVNSTFLRMVPRAKPYTVTNYELFQKIVHTAFCYRRKTIRNALKSYIHDIDLTTIGISKDARPEELTIQDYTKISDLITQIKAP